MKRVHLALWVAITLIFVACESIPTQPQQIASLEIGSLAKQPRTVAKLDSILPTGTVYGPQNDSTVVDTATGGETLPGGYWIDNLKSSAYKVHLYAEMKVSFDSLSTVAIASPVNLKYFNSSQWVNVYSDTTVSAESIITNASGSGNITVSTRSDIEEEQGGSN